METRMESGNGSPIGNGRGSRAAVRVRVFLHFIATAALLTVAWVASPSNVATTAPAASDGPYTISILDCGRDFRRLHRAVDGSGGAVGQLGGRAWKHNRLWPVSTAGSFSCTRREPMLREF